MAEIVNDLVDAGYLTKFREGRRNRYDVHEKLPLRHPQHRKTGRGPSGARGVGEHGHGPSRDRVAGVVDAVRAAAG